MNLINYKSSVIKHITGLYVIVDADWNPLNSHRDFAMCVLDGGCNLIQLRMKGRDKDLVLKSAEEIAALKEKYDFRFIINDYPDIAISVGADGVHVGSGDISPSDIKAEYGNNLIVGYSSHSVDEAIEASRNNADYIAFGAIFPTPTKGAGHPVQGVSKLKLLVDILDVPIVGIGGINRGNIENVVSTGVNSIAMISSICMAKDIKNEVAYFINQMNGG